MAKGTADARNEERFKLTDVLHVLLNLQEHKIHIRDAYESDDIQMLPIILNETD
jgi:hypothetical protein